MWGCLGGGRNWTWYSEVVSWWLDESGLRYEGGMGKTDVP